MRQLTKHAFEVGDALRGGHKLVAARCDLYEFDAITRIDLEVVANLGGDGDASFAGETSCCHLEFLFPHSKVRSCIAQQSCAKTSCTFHAGKVANLAASYKLMTNMKRGVAKFEFITE